MNKISLKYELSKIYILNGLRHKHPTTSFFPKMCQPRQRPFQLFRSDLDPKRGSRSDGRKFLGGQMGSLVKGYRPFFYGAHFEPYSTEK